MHKEKLSLRSKISHGIKYILFFTIFFALFFVFSHSAQAARYWIGDSGNWTDTAHWSTDDGGSGGAAVPTSTDNVFFTAASFSAISTVTVDAIANMADLDMSAIDQTVTLSNSTYAFNVYGSLTLPATNLTVTFSGTGYLYFKATTTGKTITSGAVTRNWNSIRFDGVGGVWTLQDNSNFSGTDIYLMNGELDINSRTLTCGIFYTSTGTKTLTFSTGTLTTIHFYNNNDTGFTLNQGTSLITFTFNFYGGGKTYYNVSGLGGQNKQLKGANIFNNLNITGDNSIYIIYDNQTINGLLTLTSSASGMKRSLVRSDILGTSRTFTVNTGGTVALTNVDFRDIHLHNTDADPYDASAMELGDAGGNSGMTFRTGESRYYHVGTGNFHDAKWFSETNGGGVAKGMPLPQDTAVFDNNSTDGTATITIANPRIGSIDMSLVDDVVTLALSNDVQVYGNYILGTNITPSGNKGLYFYGTGNYDINLYDKTVYDFITYRGVYTIKSNFTVSNRFILAGVSRTVRSTVDFNDFNITASIVDMGTYYAIIYFGNGTLTITGTSDMLMWTGLDFVYYMEGSTIKFSPSSGSSNIKLYVYGAGISFNNIWFSGSHTGNFDITGSNTFNNIKIDAGRKVRFTAGTTTTTTTFTAVGTAGNLITLDSTTTGTYNLTKAGGGTISSDYLNIQHSIARPWSGASGIDTWYAGSNSVNNQGVATAGNGWIFSDLTPDAFTFTDQTGKNLNTVSESNTITVSGIDAATAISISSCTGTVCEYSKNGGAYTAVAGTVVNGDTVKVHQTSAGTISTTTNLVLDIGGVTDTFSVTTTDDATPPTISVITTVTTPTKDTTPNYVFTTNEAGTITYGGTCTSSSKTTATVGENTVTFDALAEATYTNCTITVTDAALNPSTPLAVNTFTVDTTPPTVTQITAVPTPTNDTTPNYTFNTTEAGTISYGGSCSSSTTSTTTGNKTITFNALAEGTYTNCTITVTDAALNPSTPLAVNTFTVDTTPPVVTQITAVPTPTNDTTPNYTFNTTEAGTISYGGSCSSGTTTTTAGNKTITFNALAEGTYDDCTITVTDAALNPSTPRAVTSFTVDFTPSTLVQTVPVPTPTKDTTPDYTFTSTQAGTISYGGLCISSDTTADVGINTVTFNELAEDTYDDCTITVTDSANNPSEVLPVNDFIIDLTSPVITLLGSADVTIYAGETYVDQGATATDGIDGDITSTITVVNNVNTENKGTYTVTYNVSDQAGNPAQEVARTVIVARQSSSSGSSSSIFSLFSPNQQTPTESKLETVVNNLWEGIKETPAKIVQNLIPEFLKPKVTETKTPEVPVEELVAKETPLAFRGNWELLISDRVKEFVLAPLPEDIRKLAQKFPELGKTLKEVGINKITDVEKLMSTNFTLPGLTERVGLPDTKITLGKLSLPASVPVAKLTLEEKKKIPSEIIFAKTGGELIDFDINLSLNDQGKTEQKITTIVGKPLELVVKPENKVKSIKGYVVFKSKGSSSSSNLSLREIIASKLFASPILAYPQQKPVQVENKLVLLEFEYTDPDGDGIYTANIESPLVDGEYEIITVMEFEDAKLGKKEIRLITVVDPEGYVYANSTLGETRIAKATVSIYWLNSKTKEYELWPAKEYQQENPQITDKTGKYSFLVPPGKYYLKVEQAKYNPYQSEIIEVKEGSGIHLNIELKAKFGWLRMMDWKIFVIIIFGMLLLYIFYRDKIKERLFKKVLESKLKSLNKTDQKL